MPAALLLALYLLAPLPAEAHNLPYTAINTVLRGDGKTIALQTELKKDVSQFYYFPDQQSDAVREFYGKYFSRNFSIWQNGEPCLFSLDRLQAEGEKTLFDGRFACPHPLSDVSELQIVSSIFSDEFVNFDHFVQVRIGNNKWELVFNKEKTAFPAEVSARAETSVGRFLRLGLMHIFTGYDHILFLLGLVLLLGSVRKMLTVVTAFTLAHSITLFLAANDIFRLPAGIVEPAIALSIAYVAIRNIMLLRNSAPSQKISERWVAAFGFGFVHGLGFASALADTAIPSSFLLPAVLLFNAGIELGQFAIIAFAYPFIALINKNKNGRKMLLAVLWAIALAGLTLALTRII